MREAYDELVKDLTHITILYIVDALKQIPTGKLNLSNSNVYNDYCESNGLLYIAYDGGNHPEYASSLFAEVTDIELNNNNSFAVNTTDGVMQSHFMPIDDLLSIADYIDYVWSIGDIDEEV